jgi:hypothetical protein
MGHTMTDDDQQALNAINRIIRQDQNADPAILAREILAVLRGHGWRPTPARPPQPWQPPQGHGTPPTTEWQQAKAKITGGTP